MKKLALLATVLCPLMLCTARNGQAASSGWKRYFPLGTNSTWTYELTNHRSARKIRFTARVKGPLYVPEIKQTLVIVDEDQLGEHHPIGYFEDGEGFLSRFLYLDYVGDRVTFPGTNSTPQRILPADPKRPKSWIDNTLTVGSKYNWHYRLTSAPEVKVAAGRFRDCILVEATVAAPDGEGENMHAIGDYAFKDWYAPDVGLIRSESHHQQLGANPEVSYELVEYRLH